MDYLGEIIIFIALFLGVASFFNAEKLRKRLNNIQDALIKKDVLDIKDIISELNEVE